ncbi:hypothetical protein [Tsuneonella flava]|uniref:hypothetical protein n=1 Tax=Tsuneonella flava TaxID=2055955 RepID=UPI0038B44E9E
MLNVEAARAQYRIQRGAMLPAAEAMGSYSRQRNSAAAPISVRPSTRWWPRMPTSAPPARPSSRACR